MIRYSFAFLLIFVAGLASTPATADDAIKPFVGTFSGESEVVTEKGNQRRKVSVTIKKSSRGFSVDWTTTIPRAGKKRKVKQYKIEFSAAKRRKLYAAGMRRNLFGKLVPLNPLEGDPYMWAAIRGKTLFVYGMHVTDDGGYEFQIYERTVEGDTMKVVFKRFRDGKQFKDITANLTRKK